MPDLLCLGEPLFEFSHIRDRDWREGVGGDVSNVAIAAARQGASAGVISRLGRDSFGAVIRNLWDEEGVDHRFVSEDDAPTGLYFIRHDADGHHFEYRRTGSAASRLARSDLDGLTDSGARMLHVSGISLAISESCRDAAFEAAHVMRRAGARIAFDPNLRLNLTTLEAARAAQRDWFGAGCHIALPGLEDARALTGQHSPDDIAAWYLNAGAEVVALTLGQDGALVATSSGRHHIPPRPTTAVDASGAGDCFDGCFLSRLLAEDPAPDAARYAVTAASLSVEGHGAVTPIPHADAVCAAL